MLRKVELENFVHFKDKTTLNIDGGGPWFLIGQNNTGKTSMFEAIRRCMSTSKNFSFSSAHDETKPMFVTCHFKNVSEEVFSTFYQPAREIGDENYVCLKFVFVKKSNEEENIIEGDVVTLEARTVVTVEEFANVKEWENILQAIYDEKENEDFSSSGFTEKVKKLDFSKNIRCGENKNTKCEKLLKEYVDDTTVITFPLRSISPVQWTNSNRLKPARGVENIKEATKRAEILSWYLENKKSLSTDEVGREKKYFALITNESGFKFKLKDNIITAYEKNGKESNVSLLKIPEGIFEAKRVAILLCLNKFKTVCLEDPDRGMHAQMVERLRDLILYDMKDKTILITSHQPTVLCPWTVSRTILFQKKYTDDSERLFKVKHLRDINTDGSLAETSRETLSKRGDKTIRIISSNHFSTIFFAKRIIFVEGVDDYLFFSSLKQLLLTEFDITNFKRGVDLDGCSKETLKKFLCSLHIVQLDGEANKIKLHNVCKDIDIEHYLLLDYDALFQNIPKRHEASVNRNIDKIRDFLEAFGLETSEEKCKAVQMNVCELEKDKIFVWAKPKKHIHGTIECVVSEISENNNLTESMNKLHVHTHTPEIQDGCKQDQNSRDQSSRDHTQRSRGYHTRCRQRGRGWNIRDRSRSDQRNITQESSRSEQKKSKKKKLFNDKMITSDDITQAVGLLIETAKEEKNQVSRLLEFLCKYAVQQGKHNGKSH